LLRDEYELLLEKEETQEIIWSLKETAFPGVLKDILPEPERERVGMEGSGGSWAGQGDWGRTRDQVDPLYKHGWDVVRGELQMEMDKGEFDTWVRNIRLVKVEGGEFVFETSNSYARDWLEEHLESRLAKKLAPLIAREGEKKARVVFVCR
jgi:hypothetical protein